MKHPAICLFLFLALGCASLPKTAKSRSLSQNPVLTADSSGTVRLSVSSDPHWGSARTDPLARRAIISRVAAAIPRRDAFIILGDIAHLGGGTQAVRSASRELASGLDGTPVIAIPGNHDGWFGGLANFRRYFEPSGNQAAENYAPCFSLEAGSALLVFLNLPWSSKTFTLHQRTWLAGILESAKSANKPVIVFSHSFFYASGITEAVSGIKWYDNEKNIEALEPVFRKYGVKLVISGHNHYMELLESGGVAYAIVGTMGGHLDPAPSYVSPASLWFRQGSFGSLDLDIGNRGMLLRFVDSAGIVLKEHTIPF